VHHGRCAELLQPKHERAKSRHVTCLTPKALVAQLLPALHHHQYVRGTLALTGHCLVRPAVLHLVRTVGRWLVHNASCTESQLGASCLQNIFAYSRLEQRQHQWDRDHSLRTLALGAA
jgi:hypothetical protein